ncbi:MAG: CRISPR-associated endonuclease Cas2 [Magnetococcales bacterium]|nr:CRISPR-associated endonuclease Cas2 [Magnetococcales bacterium]
MTDHLYIIAYDIADARRWRRVFKIMKGYGEWLQLSIFQCRLTAKQYVELTIALSTTIKAEEDHVLFLNLGPADSVRPKVESLGKKFNPLGREAIII